MEIRSEVESDVAWVKISGRMVFDGSLFRLREQVLYQLASGVRRFVIDVSEVSHVDSSGCGEVISVFTSISREKGSLVFVNPNERIRVLWTYTKLIDVLTIFDTLDEARDFVVRR